MKKIILSLLFITMIMTMGFAEARNALLIANGQYSHFSSLKNPVPEAEDLAKSLKQLGFDVVIKSNLSKEQMLDSLEDFAKKVKGKGGIAFFHYGGHAVQVKGINYLIPADANIEEEKRVQTRAVNLDEVMASMQGEANIVVLDSCRDNPLPSGEGRSASRGLVPTNHKPNNSIIVYSAQAGSTAQDGVFTPLLTKMITQQKSFTQIIRDVRVAVKEKTNNMQIPGSYDDSDNEIYLAGSVAAMETVEKEKSKKEYEDLEKEIENIKAQMTAKQTEKEKQKAHEELQKKESAAKQKKLELEEKQRLEERRLALEKRKREIQAEYEKNQEVQEKEFLSMQELNARKQKLLQESQKNAATLDDIIESSISMKKTILDITNNYNNARKKSLAQTDEFYKKKYAEIDNMKPDDIFELKEEFEERKLMELNTYRNNEKEEKEQINQRYDNEIAESTKDFAKQIKDNKEKGVAVKKNVKVDFGEYNTEGQFFPGTISYKSSYITVSDNFSIDIKSENRAERAAKGKDILKKIKSKGYIGEIEQTLVDATPMVKSYRIIDISDNSVVFQRTLYHFGNAIPALDETLSGNESQNTDYVVKNTWFVGNYQKHRTLYASLIGVGSGVGGGGIALLAIGAVNTADCFTRGFDKGLYVSLAMLSVGVGLNVVSAVIMPVAGGLWYKDASMNGRIQNKVQYYKSSGLTRRQKAFIALNTFDLFGGYDYENDKAVMGMGIKL